MTGENSKVHVQNLRLSLMGWLTLLSLLSLLSLSISLCQSRARSFFLTLSLLISRCLSFSPCSLSLSFSRFLCLSSSPHTFSLQLGYIQVHNPNIFMTTDNMSTFLHAHFYTCPCTQKLRLHRRRRKRNGRGIRAALGGAS
jgi:hypothetical protein